MVREGNEREVDGRGRGWKRGEGGEDRTIALSFTMIVVARRARRNRN